LRVVGKCDCGCDSVDFVEQGKIKHAKPIADGIGSTSRGGKVGVIIWGTPEVITGLEIYDLGAGDVDIKLPTPESIMPFENSNTPITPSRGAKSIAPHVGFPVHFSSSSSLKFNQRGCKIVGGDEIDIIFDEV
jgi:hypothetical protein